MGDIINLTPEDYLSNADTALAGVIQAQRCHWPSTPSEHPIWGLLRIVMAQQVSTLVACRIAEQVKSMHPQLVVPTSGRAPEPTIFRALGVPRRRADCCVEIIKRSDEILTNIQDGKPWEQALTGIKGIGPWTISVFRIMVLRDPDVLPLGDVGLERAIRIVYGRERNVQRLAENWRPFRSVACWYLWRTLGNQQLG